MNRLHILFEIATVFPDQLKDILVQLKSYCETNRLENDQVSFVVRRSDRPVLEAVMGANHRLVEVDWIDQLSHIGLHAAIGATRETVEQLVDRGDLSVITVVSYRGEVLRSVPGTNSASTQVVTVNFQRIVGAGSPATTKRRPATVTRSVEQWRFSHISTEKEALEVLKDALRDAGAISQVSALRQASLRDAMARKDARFRGNAVSTRSQGMIGNLVALAEQKQLIYVKPRDERDAVNPFVWLNDAEATSQDQTETSVSAGHVLVTNDSAEREPASSTTASVLPTELTRSDRIKRTLCEMRLGPYPVARIALYDALDGQFSGSQQVATNNLRTLLRQAVKEAPAVVKKRGFDPARQSGVWKYAEALVKKLVLRSGGLLSADGPVGPGLGADLIMVERLSADWRARADSQLVLAYIVEVGRLEEDAVEDLAAVMFASRDDDPYGSTVDAIRHLIDEGSIVEMETERGMEYVLAANGPGSIVTERSPLLSIDSLKDTGTDA